MAKTEIARRQLYGWYSYGMNEFKTTYSNKKGQWYHQRVMIRAPRTCVLVHLFLVLCQTTTF